MKTRLTLGLFIAVILVVSAPLALSQGRGKEKRTTGERVRDVLPEAQVVFTREETVLVKNWFTTNRSSLPPGLAKRDRLPPGLARQLRERGTLPPGLQKKTQSMPVELERRLRVLPTGYRRVVIADNVVLLNEKTAVIYDIIRNVIP